MPTSPVIYSIIEAPTHPDFSTLYASLGLKQLVLNSQRKAITQLKKTPPQWVVAEFFYGYGNNYAGINISNLDVFLHSLRKYAPEAKVVIISSKTDFPHTAKLAELFDIHKVLCHPVSESEMTEAISS